MESDITFHIGKQEAELALKVNSAAYHGDLYQLKGLVRAGADPNKTDYDGRSPLVRNRLCFTFYSMKTFFIGVDIELLWLNDCCFSTASCSIQRIRGYSSFPYSGRSKH